MFGKNAGVVCHAAPDAFCPFQWPFFLSPEHTGRFTICICQQQHTWPDMYSALWPSFNIIHNKLRRTHLFAVCAWWTCKENKTNCGNRKMFFVSFECKLIKIPFACFAYGLDGAYKRAMCLVAYWSFNLPVFPARCADISVGFGDNVYYAEARLALDIFNAIKRFTYYVVESISFSIQYARTWTNVPRSCISYFVFIYPHLCA